MTTRSQKKQADKTKAPRLQPAQSTASLKATHLQPAGSAADFSKVIVAPTTPQRSADVLTLQRMLGNRATLQLLARRQEQQARNLSPRPEVGRSLNSQQSVVQRLFLPLEDPGPRLRRAVLNSYYKVIKYRGDEIKALATESVAGALKELNAAKGDEDKEWAALSNLITLLNQQEALRGEGAGPGKMKAEEKIDIYAKLHGAIPAAQALLQKLQGADNILKQVFGTEDAIINQARAGMTAISTQLETYVDKNNIFLDVDKSIAASGSTLQNVGNAKTAEAKMYVTTTWARLNDKKQATALVHEASHGSALGTRDLAYLDTWTMESMIGEEALKNAAHYEKAAEIIAGLRKEGMKSLTVTDPSFESKVRGVLVNADKLVTQSILWTGRVSNVLKETKTDNLVGKLLLESLLDKLEGSKDKLRLVLRLAKHLELPFFQAPDVAKITNADLEMMTMYRSMLMTLRKSVNLTNTAAIKISPESNQRAAFAEQTLAVTTGLLSQNNEVIRQKVLEAMINNIDQVPETWKIGLHEGMTILTSIA